MYWLPALLLACVATGAHAQATAQTSVAPDLRECYTDPLLLNRNNLPPTTINVLIDIIRQIEDNPNVNVDLRTMATLLLHTYRQDGVQYHERTGSNIAMSTNVLPFSPTFHSFHRHRLVLRLIPGNMQTLPNDTISSQLKCALHHMLSTTVDARIRGDENNCGQNSQYRALRTYRSARSIDEDVEVLDLTQLGADKNGQLHQLDPDSDVEYTSNYGSRSARQLVGESACPILTGVVNTRWGPVSAGNLIAGIAAGAEPQGVNILELTKGSVLNYPNVQPFVTSIFPATLSGDLAEAVLIQGTQGSQSISVGSTGNWNSTQTIARTYMLSARTNLEMTDPEIRGGIDGFVLGGSIIRTLGISSDLRLSQLLDMYYSPRNGVFDTNIRACNRRAAIQVIPAVLFQETRSFAAALDSVMPLQGTLTGGLDGLVNSAVTNFGLYSNTNMNDMNCAITESTITDVQYRTNLYIAIDPTWPYNMIYPAISFLLDSLDVSKFGSSITLISPFDGTVITSKTFSIAEFHSAYTATTHQTILSGINLELGLANIRLMMQEELRNETSTGYVGGHSTVLLYLIHSGPVQNNPNVLEQARLLNETVPDLYVHYASSTNQFDNLATLVRDPHRDLTVLNLDAVGTNVASTMGPVLSQIQLVGRRVINPLCGDNFTAGASGGRQFDDFLEPGYINFYRVSPNYFYANNDNTRVRVARTGVAVGTLVVCHSRTVAAPRRNTTFVGVDPNEITCQNLAATGNVEITLQGACDAFSTIGSCPPLYFSVQAITTTPTTTNICQDASICRFPYNVRYQIQVQDLVCFSSATSMVSSVIFVLLGLILNMFRGH